MAPYYLLLADCSGAEAIRHLATGVPLYKVVRQSIELAYHFLVHGQVTIIFVVSVCLFVCLFVSLFVQSFSQPSLIRFLANVNSRSRSLYAIARPSVVCLSVTFVRPTQAVQIFGNISTVFGTLAIR